MITRSLITAAAVGCALASTSTLSAQTAETPTLPERHARWELVVPTGTIVPTGTQRDAIKRGNMTAAQLSYVVHPSLAVTATVGWARSRDVAAANDPKLDVFSYDLGAEARAPRWGASKGVTFMPFAGVGAGARSYNYRSLDVDATHNLAAYASAGGELGARRIRLRLEARDYVTGFRPLAGGGGADTRNDVVLMAGLRYVRR
jgi:hypothetical protein